MSFLNVDRISVITVNTPNSVILDKLKKIPYNSHFIMNGINAWKGDHNNFHHKWKVADWWEKKNSGNRFWDRKVTVGEIGCSLSHYGAIEDAYNDGRENVLILEEDFNVVDYLTIDEVNNYPKDYSLIYLGRKAKYLDDEKSYNEYYNHCKYSYNTHAYILSRKGMKQVLDSPLLDNVIAADEFMSALFGETDRDDAKKIFYNPDFKAYSLKREAIDQSSHADFDSLTEFSPDEIEINKSKMQGKTGTPSKQVYPLNQPVDINWDGNILNLGKSNPQGMVLETGPININPTPNQPKSIGIRDFNNWEAWSEKYINAQVRNKEYDLIIDELGPNIYLFPLLTKEFCNDFIEESEKTPWTQKRHEYYPTTDKLLNDMGFEACWRRVINEYVNPLAHHIWKLEGDEWKVLKDESFILKYNPDNQAHLAVHHDYSDITTLINLNPQDFEGGGTYFPQYKVLASPKEPGMCTLHPGNITHKHGARPVTKGTRYAVVSFIRSGTHKGWNELKDIDTQW